MYFHKFVKSAIYIVASFTKGGQARHQWNFCLGPRRPMNAHTTRTRPPRAGSGSTATQGSPQVRAVTTAAMEDKLQGHRPCGRLDDQHHR